MKLTRVGKRQLKAADALIKAAVGRVTAQKDFEAYLDELFADDVAVMVQKDAERAARAPHLFQKDNRRVLRTTKLAR